MTSSFPARSLLIPLLSILAVATEAAEIIVRVNGAPADSTLVLQVYDSANTFGDFRDPVKELRARAQTDAEYRLDGIPPGKIAVLVYVDENENGRIDKNFIGIPKEMLGISNGYRPKGPPAFELAAVTVTEDAPTSIDIELNKILGERGRLGAGAGVIGRGSPYVGSDSNVLKAIPAITYNGERLQWLGPTVQYGFAGTGRWRIAASASYRIGVYEEDDSPALAGLGDRDGTLMAGLALRYELPGGANLSLSHERDVLDRIGGTESKIRISKAFQASRLRISPQLQANWMSADLVNYDYGVPSFAATESRPAYTPGSTVSYNAGFTGFVELTENWQLMLNLSVEFLPREIENSPIVDDDRVAQGFAAITYVF
jgi:outer membrane protein